MKLNIKTQNNDYFKIDCEKGKKLIDIIKKEKINFTFPCGGKGRCGNCKIKITKGLEKPSKLDEMKINREEIEKGVRLACCLFIKQDTDMEIRETETFNLLD